MKKWTISIPLRLPKANDYIRYHWSKQQRTRNEWRRLLDLFGGNIPPAAKPRKVRVISYRKQLLDRDDALYLTADKVILDSLVRLELLVDDKSEWCKLEVKQVKMNWDEFTVVEISE